MSFFSPLSLLWLLPMGGLIIVMYILKLRRKDVVVSSTMLWRQVIRDVQANAPFQKLRKNLLMFLQLAVMALLVLALARPFWRTRGLGGRSVVIVVDTSASMEATDVRPNRIQAARDEAMKLVNDMRPGDQILLVSAAAKPEGLTGFTSSRADLARAIDSLKPHETGTNMRDAVNLAAALVASREASQIDIISDGAFPPVTNVNLGKAHVQYHRIGSTDHNVGIVAVDYRRSLGGDNTVQVFVTVHNFDKVKRTQNVTLLHDREVVDAHEVALDAGGENSEVFELPEPDRSLELRVELDAKDDLAADNGAALVISPRKTVRALLVTNENVFLETSIKVDPNVELSVTKPGGATRPQDYDVVVFDGSAPKTLPAGNYLFIDCGSDRCPAEPGAEAPNQSIIDPNRTHPLLRYVDFGNTRWTAMRRGTPKPWAQELASSENGPAIVVGQQGLSRAAWLGFNLDLAHGVFPLTVSYPILVSNTLRWLARADDANAMQARTGEPVTLTPPTAGKLTVTRPDGSRRDLAATANGTAVFDDTGEVGVYRVTGDGGYQTAFAANLADYAESDILPRNTLDFGENPPGQPGHAVPVVRELWPWLAAMVLGLLALEWWAFHRRVFVQ